MLIADNGIIIRTHVNQISSLSRVSQGVKVMKIKDENKIVTVALVKKEENENSDDNNELTEESQSFRAVLDNIDNQIEENNNQENDDILQNELNQDNNSEEE